MLSAGSISYSLNGKEDSNNIKISQNEDSQKIEDIKPENEESKEQKNNSSFIKTEISQNLKSPKKENNLSSDKVINSKKKISNNINIGKIINFSNADYIDNKDKILVNYEDNNGDPRFVFFDNKNLLLGSFSISQLIKFLSSPYIKSSEGIEDISFELIRNLIFDIHIDKDTSNVEMRFKPYMDSPFTGNLEMLLKLSGGMKDYENNMENELLKIDNLNTRKKVKLIVKQFNYCLLNHMLRVIHSISEQIKNDSDKNELKDKLLKYSLGINYRIGSYIRNQLDNQIEQNKKIGENMISLLDVKKKIINKLDTLENIISKQNNKIDELINKMNDKESHKESKKTKSPENKSPSLNNGSSSSSNASRSIISSMEEKLKEKFKINNLNELFEDNDNNYESDEGTRSIESIESLESPKNIDKSETLSQVSGIYKINYGN